MEYARLAGQVADGRFALTDSHYTYRWGLIIPAGICYKIFGINDFSSALWPLMTTLLTLFLVWKMSGKMSLPARVFALLFTLLSEWIFFYSNKIMPDIPVMAFLTLAFYGYFESRFGQWIAGRAGLMTAGSMLFGFLCKETVILTLPVWMYLFAADLVQKRNKSYWRAVAVSGVLALAAYLGLIWMLTGNWNSRFTAIAANSYFSQCSYDQLPVEHLYRRIGYELWVIFYQTGVAGGFLFLLPSLLQSPQRSWVKVVNPEGFFLLSGLGLLLVSNFMSTSVSHYVPLCVDIRHYLFAVPFLGLASAVFLERIMLEKALPGHLVALFISLMAVWIGFRYFPDQRNIYLLFAGALMVSLLWKMLAKKPVSPWLWLIFYLPLFWKPVQVMRAARKSNYAAQQEMVDKNMQQTTAKQMLVITNPVEKNVDEYLMQFDTAKVQWMSFREMDKPRIMAADSVAVIINGSTAWLSGMDWEAMPDWVRQPDSSRVLIWSKDGIELYGLNKSDLLRRLQ